jgi:hypothetical protein
MPPTAPVDAVTFYVDPRVDIERDPGTLSPIVASCLGAVSRVEWPGLPRRVADPADGDFWVAPRVWGYYGTPSRLDDLNALVRDAAAADATLLIWHTGDLTPIPPPSRCVLLAHALNRSRRQRHWHIAPRFIDDPLVSQRKGQLPLRRKGPRPVVGFCGYADAAAWKVAYSVVHGLALRASAAAARLRGQPAFFEAAPLLPAARLRARVLRALERDARIDAQFIVRRRYRAGARQAGPDHPTVTQFFDNVFGTDYTVCVRGYGNWSIRFYETLACGRIPVFVDTDCTLPFENTVDWRRHCVWVPGHDVRRAGDYVAEFHGRLSDDAFERLQRDNREIWETRLTRAGFLSHLHEYRPLPAVRPAGTPAEARSLAGVDVAVT